MQNDHTHVDEDCTNCFKALGVGTKYKIYDYLNKSHKSNVSDLVAYLGLTQPTISHHLADMKEKGLLQSKKVGKEVYYSINLICPHKHSACVVAKIFKD